MATLTFLFTRAASRLLFPEVCSICRKGLDLLEHVLCKNCLKQVKMLEGPLCKTCSRPLPPFGKYRTRCSVCQNAKLFVSNVTAAVPFDDIHRTLIHAIKFRKKRWIFDLYGALIKRMPGIADHLEADLILPVPIDFLKKRVREFNQAKDLADLVERITGAPLLNNVLRRRIGFHPQSTLKRKERAENIRNRFYVRNKAAIQNKTILLVDDILTTGATVNECARTLLEAGARKVDAFVLARALTV
ncbi:MAG: ComF family protein [Candidatus Omnitrophica bacterium]|nr:ComF family protein [Candidatus Omnitrophota bacterium]